MDIKIILKEMIERGASDLHLKVASAPVYRINGTLVYTDYEAPNVDDMAAVAQQILSPSQRDVFESTREIDFAFGVPGIARFRANFYVQRGSVAMVFRHVPVDIQTIDELGYTSLLGKVALEGLRHLEPVVVAAHLVTLHSHRQPQFALPDVPITPLPFKVVVGAPAGTILTRSGDLFPIL